MRGEEQRARPTARAAARFQHSTLRVPFYFWFCFLCSLSVLGRRSGAGLDGTLIQDVWDELVIISKHNHGKWLLIA